MADRQIHSVQTFIRIIYADGTVAGIMAPSAAVDPAMPVPQEIQARQFLNQQSRLLLDQFCETGPAGLYAAAVASSHAVPSHVPPRAATQERTPPQGSLGG